MKDLISKYHQVDPLWEIWNINSHDEFNEKYMVKGKFHKEVPNEIIKEYEIVERLICYSYYHYSMIDEAFAKVTRIFESGVNLRLKQLGINIPNQENNSNKPKFVSLSDKLKKIKNQTSPEIFSQWTNFIKLRNTFAHPIPERLFGITIHNSFVHAINMLNTLFLDKTSIENNENELIELKNKAKHLKKGLFIFEHNSIKYLISSIEPLVAFNYKNKLKSLWIFTPVLKDFPQNDEQINFSPCFFFRISDEEINHQGFKGIDINSGNIVELIKTDKLENIETLKKYESLFNSSEERVKIILKSLSNKDLLDNVKSFLYNECW